ncbi:MAG: TonB family protein [Deltaproteobacteria bacterium]|nr:TonB family protein [Deltaproteobacteria bacterium]
MAKKGELLKVVLEHDGKRHEFEQKSVIIGSGPAANLQLEDDSVSGVHAILRAGSDPGIALISDLGSEEGTRINGEEVVREAEVRRGDTLKIGQMEVFVVGVGEDAVETKAEPVHKAKPAKEVAPMVEGPTKPDVQKPARPPKPAPSRTEDRKAAKPPPRPEKKPEKKIETGTQVVRKREIPRQVETVAPISGERFFTRTIHPYDKPRPGDRSLEVKVFWGRICLDSRTFPEGSVVTVGEHPRASFQLSTDRFPGELFTLASPGGKDGHVIQVASGMELEVRRDGKAVDVDELPSRGAVRSYQLQLGDRARVMMGQIAFVIEYVSSPRGVQAAGMAGRDCQMAKWWTTFFIVAVGAWLMIEATPKAEMEVADYLKDPARFAKMILPTSNVEKKKTFEEIKKKKEEKPKFEDDGKWKKVTARSKTKDADIPREVKRERDRKVATNAGILGLLKGRGGGTGDNASSVFGGAAMANLDASLDGIARTGMGDSSGFGGMGTRGGGPGGGGGGLGLGGMGTAGYGRGSGAGYGSVKIGHRGKSRVKVVKGRTRIVGGLSQEVVGKYIKRYWAQFKFCYERELSKNPNLYGKITTTFTIAGNGRVSEAQVIHSSMHNANVEQCLLRVIRRIRFPAPRGGGQVIVTYPFMFTTAG